VVRVGFFIRFLYHEAWDSPLANKLIIEALLNHIWEKGIKGGREGGFHICRMYLII
jgi:hypothetical protein